MRRFGALLLLTIALLAGCGGRESPVSPDEAPGLSRTCCAGCLIRRSEYLRLLRLRTLAVITLRSIRTYAAGCSDSRHNYFLLENKCQIRLFTWFLY